MKHWTYAIFILSRSVTAERMIENYNNWHKQAIECYDFLQFHMNQYDDNKFNESTFTGYDLYAIE